MNKRIAKKVSKIGYMAGRCPWESHGKRMHLKRIAERTLNRRNTPLRRTANLLYRCGYWPTIHDTSDNRRMLIEGWDRLRPVLIKHGPGEEYHGRGLAMRRMEYRRTFPPTEPVDCTSQGYVTGCWEVKEFKAKGENLFEATLDTLSYFSDRWTCGRVGRMDAMVDAIRYDSET